MFKGYVVTALILCLFFSAAYAQTNRYDTGEGEHAERTSRTSLQTTLRVAKPVGVFTTRGAESYIRRATVEVKNVGEVPANDVRVTLQLPTGVRAAMDGELTIQPKKSATFTYLAERDEPVPPKKDIKAVATCLNCR